MSGTDTPVVGTQVYCNIVEWHGTQREDCVVAFVCIVMYYGYTSEFTRVHWNHSRSRYVFLLPVVSDRYECAHWFIQFMLCKQNVMYTRLASRYVIRTWTVMHYAIEIDDNNIIWITVHGTCIRREREKTVLTWKTHRGGRVLFYLGTCIACLPECLARETDMLLQ